MNGPFVVAQANSVNSGATPVQVIKLVKPEAGHTEIFHASFTGLVKIDFSAIANEKITLFHDSKNQSLHIIFADGSQDIIEPFFDSRGTILSNLVLDMGSGQEFNGERFASQFPITEDVSVLPAAGPGGVASGADFHGPSVDPLALGNPLDLLPAEELPNIVFHPEQAPLLVEQQLEQQQTFAPFTFTSITGIVEEEELNLNIRRDTANGQGNEDNNDKSGNDADNLPTDNTTNIITGDFSTVVHGGVGGTLTFGANAGANGHPVFAADGITQITSIGEKVVYELHGANDIWGVTVPQHGEGERTVFILHIDSNGQFTFTLTDQIDHPLHSHDDSTTNPAHQRGIFEETLDLDLSIAVGGHDVANNQFVLPTGTFDVGVIDDTPIVFQGAHENVIVDENDIDTNLSHGTSPNDGNGDGSFTGSPGDNLPGPATVSGDLSGLVNVGADAVDAFNHGTFAFTTDGSKLSDLETIGLKSQGHLLEYAIVDTNPNDGFQILQATTDDHRTVFELKLFSDGHFEFSLFDQVDHDPPFDQDPPGFISQDPTSGGNNFPLSDRNTDLIDNDDPNGHPRILDIDQINFGALIDFSDADHDTVSLDGAFTISIRDDVPKLIHGETISLTVDEDDISTLGSNPNPGSLGTSPNDGNGDGSFTGDPNNGNSKGPAFVSGTLAGNVVEVGADEPLTFSFTGNAVSYFLSLGLESQGHHLSYEVVGNELIGFVDNRINIGATYDQGIDRLVFTFELTNIHTGHFEFSLFDQLDHDPPPNGTLADQNFGLVDDVPGQDVTALDFGHVIKATDFDGDSVVLNDKLEIHVRDDIPTVDAKFNGSENVIVDETVGQQNDDTTSSSVSNLFNNVGHKGTDPDMTTQYARSTTNVVSANITIGADEGGSAHWSLVLGNGNNDSGLQTTDGHEIFLFKEGNLIVGRYDGPDGGTDVSNNGTDPAAFAIAIDDQGRISVAQFVSLNHPAQANAGDGFNSYDENIFLPAGKISAVITVTDFDNDVATDSVDIGPRVGFSDDGPTAPSVSANPNHTVTHDETPGVQTVADPNAQDDVAGSTLVNFNGVAGTPIFSLFSGVSNKGSDADVASKDNGAIGFADSNGSLLSLGLLNFGADGPLGGSNATGTAYAFKISSSGVNSGVKTTDGHEIDLFLENGIVVGRVVGGTDNGNAAFAVTVDPQTGEVYLAQYLSLQHPDQANSGNGFNSYDELVTLTNNAVQLTVTLTDGDHDTVTTAVDVGGQIKFQDDGPNVVFVFSAGTVTHDETPGANPAEGTNASNDVLGSSLDPAILAEFNAIHDKGIDPDVTLLDNSAIGFAKSRIAFVGGVADFGSDGPAATNSNVLSLTIPADHTDSGLFTTDGHQIFLFNENGVIVGRYDGNDANGDVTNDGTDPAAFAIAISPDGSVSVAQYVSLQHPSEANSGNNFNSYDESVQLASGTVSAAITLTDGDGDKSTKSIDISNSIRFQDDGPHASGESECVNEGGQVKVNLVLILDVSGSMLDDPGVPGFATRLDLAKAAAINLINTANVNQIMVVSFSDSTDHNTEAGNVWTSKLDAINYINGLSAGGNTHYNDAIDEVTGNWGAGPTAADQTAVYFLSDGVPNPASQGLDTTEETNWINFLNNPDGNAGTSDAVTQVFGIGIGSGLSGGDKDQLEPIAWHPGEIAGTTSSGASDPNVIVVTDQSQLSATLTGTLPGLTTGNVLTNDGFGADGPQTVGAAHAFDGILSITVGADEYAFDGTNITKNGGAYAPGVGTSTLDVTTPIGGHFVFHFASGGLFNAGDYSYQAPANVNGDQTETFHYVLADGDNDQVAADLSICVDDTSTPLVQTGTFVGLVEEEQLNSAAAHGIDDTTSSPTGDKNPSTPDGDDDVVGNLNVTTDVTSGNLNSLILSGLDGTATFGFQITDGSHATFVGGGNITSEGQDVLLDVQGNTVWGFVNVGGGATTYDPASGDRAVFKLDLTPSSGAFTFTLLDNIDHHPVNSADNVEGIKELDLGGKLTVTDSADNETMAFNNVSVKIIDDIPAAAGESANVNEGGGTVNLVLILDVSGSMLDDPGVPGFATRLDLAKAAAINLINTANVNQIMVVSFSDSTDHNTEAGNVWTSKLDAINYINGLSAGGNTHYNDAIDEVTGNWGAGPTAADQTAVYFLSDGVPNPASQGLDTTEETNWINFLNNPDGNAGTSDAVTQVFGIGIGSGLSGGDKDQLEPIAWHPGEIAGTTSSGASDPNVIVVTDQSQLSATLTGTLPGLTTGNVLTNDGFGADGPHTVGAAHAFDGILSIKVGADEYEFDGTNITKNHGAYAPGVGTSTLDVTTFPIGGHFVFHFASGGGSNAGDYSYQAPASVTSDQTETFHYVIADGDGDQVGADLSVTVHNVNQAPTITSGTTGTEAENTVNTNVVYDTNATDPDSDTITYSLSAGGDNNFFNINSSTGEVRFNSPPNFEAPSDAGGNNVYDILVHANDGHGHDVTKAVAITISNVNEFAPVITSNLGGTTAAISIPENTTAVTTVTATDADTGTTLTYSISGGADAGKFAINSSTGALSFISAPNFEAPTDSGPNNVYDVIVQASDGTNVDTQAIAVTVTDVDETAAPAITSPASLLYFAEVATGAVSPINRISFQDADNPATVRVTLSMDNASDALIAADGGGVDVTGSGASSITLDGTIAAINQFLYHNNVHWDPNGNNDGETGVLTVTIDDNGTAAGGHIVSTNVDISEFVPDGGSTITNDYSGVNITGSADFTPPSGAGNPDTITTAWSHESSTRVLYDGLGDSGGDDTITLVFTPDQLSEILADTTMQSALRGFLDGSPGTLDLSASSWNAIVQNYEVAHIDLATGYGNGTFNVDSIMMPTPAADSSPDGNEDLVLGTSGNDTDLGGASGSNGNDVIVGLAGNDTLFGGAGDDLLLGGDGNDTLTGGTGNDVLAGGAGADHFRYNATNEGTDHILDFSAAEGDSIDILASAFAGVPAAGQDATGVFSASANNTFANGSERFHYNTASHTLLYDADGNGAGSTAVALAVLENGAAVNAQNIHMV